ncbi:uncharacterized protein LOC128390497 [Panonychus citri]|uniref:uncharacterized protein LOC128390497 n=1 Tax=Panonychus citri TaxID=50023 RepID=UPI002307BF9D|nr:uncharacterized protein LOC128390497 [Panonychus citri]
MDKKFFNEFTCSDGFPIQFGVNLKMLSKLLKNVDKDNQITFLYDTNKAKLTLTTQFGYEYKIDIMDTDEEPIADTEIRCHVDAEFCMQSDSFIRLVYGLSYTSSKFFMLNFNKKNNCVTFVSAKADISVRRTIYHDEQRNQMVVVTSDQDSLQTLVYKNDIFIRLCKLFSETQTISLSVDVNRKLTMCALRSKDAHKLDYYKCTIFIPFEQNIDTHAII